MYKNFEKGRSMIEMLGVLAIIGVLSVGGLAGYSKAMLKYKTNKTIEQTTQVITGLITAFANQNHITGTSTIFPNEIDSNEPEDIELFKALGIIDSQMLDNNGKLKSPLGGEFFVMGAVDEFRIMLYDLPREACIALATTDWANTAIAVNNSETSFKTIASDCFNPEDYDTWTDAGAGWALGCKRDGGIPLTPDKAALGCSCNNATCTIELLFHLIDFM